MQAQSKIVTLSNLRPETVLGIENAGFTEKAKALPGVIFASESITEARRFLGGFEHNSSLTSLCRLKPEYSERIIVTDTHLFIGGLVSDDCGDIESPSEGRVAHYGRRGNATEHAAFYQAMGLTSDGDRLLNEEAVSDQLLELISPTVRSNRSLMTTLSNLLRSQGKSGTWDNVIKTLNSCVWKEGAEFALDYVADEFCESSWWNNLTVEWQEKLSPLADLLGASNVEKAYERAVSLGQIGNPMAVALDIYEHGLVQYSVSGEGTQCRWDTSHCGAVWIPNEDAKEEILRRVQSAFPDGVDAQSETYWATVKAEAASFCRSNMEAFSDWANGFVYCAVAYAIDRKTGLRIESSDDETGGMIGSEYAEVELESSLLNMVLHQNVFH